LKHALFYLDVDVADRGADYTPSRNRTLISGKDSPAFARKYFADECTALFNLPQGSHVLTAKQNPEFLTRTSTITHIIVYEKD
jgi:hypothetical protein